MESNVKKLPPESESSPLDGVLSALKSMESKLVAERAEHQKTRQAYEALRAACEHQVQESRRKATALEAFQSEARKLRELLNLALKRESQVKQDCVKLKTLLERSGSLTKQYFTQAQKASQELVARRDEATQIRIAAQGPQKELASAITRMREIERERESARAEMGLARRALEEALRQAQGRETELVDRIRKLEGRAPEATPPPFKPVSLAENASYKDIAQSLLIELASLRSDLPVKDVLGIVDRQIAQVETWIQSGGLRKREARDLREDLERLREQRDSLLDLINRFELSLTQQMKRVRLFKEVLKGETGFFSPAPPAP